MNRQKVQFWMVIILAGAVLLAGCAPRARVGALRTESQSVELGDAESVRVKIDFGAGDLQVTGGADKLLEADFNYNVARLKPEVEYNDGVLVVQQPDANGLPLFRNITDFRNDWELRLNDQVPMNLDVQVGGGTGNLHLADLSLTRLNVSIGAGEYTVDLSGDLRRDLNVSIDSGAANLTVRLPSDVGVRVQVESGPTLVDAPTFTKNGNVYTNAAYGESDVTLELSMVPGIGFIFLEEAEAAAAMD